MNIPGYLRKLDEEIKGHRQQIALHQVEIARLEDARRVIIGIEERDQEDHATAPGALPRAEADKPLLIVRKAAPEQEERKRQRDAEAYQRRKERQRAERADKGIKKGAMPERSAAIEARRQRVLGVFTPSSVLSPSDVVEQLGLTGDAKKAVYNDLGTLKSRGLLRQSEVGEPYTLASRPANGAPHQ